jgi:hypothetical protein
MANRTPLTPGGVIGKYQIESALAKRYLVMEPLSLLVAAGAFLAAEAAKKVGGLAVEEAFDGVKGLLKKYLGRDPEPADFTTARLREAHLDAQPAFVEQARAVVARSPAFEELRWSSGRSRARQCCG